MPSFARLLTILLRVLALMESGSKASHLSRFRVTVLESFLFSWGLPSGVRLDCMDLFNGLIQAGISFSGT
jgi:hypothetical protein